MKYLWMVIGGPILLMLALMAIIALLLFISKIGVIVFIIIVGFVLMEYGQTK